MRSQLREYYLPSDKEFQTLWKDADFAFDANVLLDIFRYSPSTTSQLIAVMEKLGSRVWIPHQAALEYQSNRHKVNAQFSSACNRAADELDSALKTLTSSLGKNAERSQVLAGVVKSFETTKTRLAAARESHAKQVPAEKLHDQISTLLDGKVGAPYSAADLAAKLKLAEARIKAKTPPGYMDTAKKSDEVYGDVLIWFQILDHVKLRQKPVIFVTGDAKEDWWWKPQGKTFGPRPELRREMYDQNAMEFYMYSPDRFLENAVAYLGSAVTDDAITEARDVQSVVRGGQSNVSYAQLLGKSAWPFSSAVAAEVHKYQTLFGTNGPTLASLFGQLPAGSSFPMSDAYRNLVAANSQYSAAAQALELYRLQQPPVGLLSTILQKGLLDESSARRFGFAANTVGGSVADTEPLDSPLASEAAIIVQPVGDEDDENQNGR